MPNADKQLAELLAEEKKLLEQQKKEQDALKQKVRAVKKQLWEEERKLNERRAALLASCRTFDVSPLLSTIVLFSSKL